MSSDVIKEFLVGLGFKIDKSSESKFTAGVNSATLKVTALGAAAVTAGNLLSNSLQRAFSSLGNLIPQVANEFSNIGALATKVNSTAHEIMQLGYVAKLTNSSVEAVNGSLSTLARLSGEAATGVGRGALIFKKFGLSVRKNNGEMKSTAELLQEIGNKVKDLDKAQQIAILSKLGIDPSLIGALTGDVKELRQEFDDIYKAAGVDANTAAESSTKFTDSLKKLQFVLDAIRKSVALKFIPIIREGMDKLRKELISNLPKITQLLVPVIGKIIELGEIFIKAGLRGVQFAAWLVQGFKRLNDATNGWIGKIILLGIAWKTLNAIILKSPLGRLIALGVAVALLVEDFIVWQKGGKSLINWASKFGKTLKVLGTIVVGLTGAFVTIKIALVAWTLATKALTIATVGATVATKAFGVALKLTPFGVLITGIALLIAGIIALVKNWETVKGWFKSFWNFLKTTADKALGNLLSDFRSVADSIIKAYEKVKDWFLGFFTWLENKWEKFTGFFSDIKNFTPGGGEFDFGPTAPSARQLNQLSGGSPTLNQETKIIVQGGGDPQATANAIEGKQSRLNADLVRDLSGSIQ